MTTAERKHLAAVASLGCIVCRNLGLGDTGPNTAIHHIRHQVGMGRRASHFETLPLCPAHHQTGGHGVAIHAGKETWERLYGTEVELLEQVRGLLA